jgi:hypothetical protein
MILFKKKTECLSKLWAKSPRKVQDQNLVSLMFFSQTGDNPFQIQENMFGPFGPCFLLIEQEVNSENSMTSISHTLRVTCKQPIKIQNNHQVLLKFKKCTFLFIQ